MSLSKLSCLLILALVSCGDDAPTGGVAQPGPRGNAAQAAAGGAEAALDPALIKQKIEALNEWAPVNPQGATQRFLDFCGEQPRQVPPQAYLRAAEVLLALEQPQGARRVLESGLQAHPQASVLEQRLAEVPRPAPDEAAGEPEQEQQEQQEQPDEGASPFQYELF